MGLQGEFGVCDPKGAQLDGSPKTKDWQAVAHRTESLPPPSNQVLTLSARPTRVRVVSPAFTPLQCPHGPGRVHPTAVSAWSGLRSPCCSVCSCRRGLLTCRSKHELFGPSESLVIPGLYRVSMDTWETLVWQNALPSCLFCFHGLCVIGWDPETHE